jgi:osmotically inducible protein OsmC
MATTRKAATHWEGSLMDGKGAVTMNSSQIGTFDVTWASRANEPAGLTSPEELIAAAHATCFSMALSHALAQAGNPPTTVDTGAEVDFQPGEGITAIRLTVRADVPGLTAEQFAEFAATAKANCPVSKALAAVPSITLDAELV